MSGAYGVQSRLGFMANGATAATQAVEFLTETLAQRTERIDTNGLKGTRARYVNRIREGRRRVSGSITLNPTAAELAFLLPYLFGASAAGTSFPLGETLTQFAAQADRVQKVFTYQGLVASRATFRGTSGQPLEMTLDLVGRTESVGNAGTFPNLSIDTATAPFVYTDSVITLNTTTYQSTEFEMTFDNGVDAERFLNSQTLVTAQATDRVVTLRLGIPYGDGSALYTPGTATLAAVVTFTNGALSLAFSYANVFAAWETPVANGRGEMVLPINGQAYRDGSTAELVTTLDSTP